MTLFSWSLKLIFHSDNNLTPAAKNRGGFTLIEVMTAVTILVAIVATVLVGINKCLASMADIQARVEAFKVARQNMEWMLGQSFAKETVEFGSLEEKPDIEWEIAVEPFTEPITSKMWMQAKSIASYTGSDGERKYIELIQWLTDLTDAQVKQIRQQQELELEMLDERIENPYGDDPEGLIMFQEYLASNGRFTQAAETAVELLRRYPESPEAKDSIINAMAYGRKLADKGEFELAADISMEMASLSPGTPIETQAIDEAIRISKQAANAGDYRSAVGISGRLSDEYPDNTKVQSVATNDFPRWVPRAEAQPEGKVTPPSSTGNETDNNTGNNDTDNNDTGDSDTGNDNTGNEDQPSGATQVDIMIEKLKRNEITLGEFLTWYFQNNK